MVVICYHSLKSRDLKQRFALLCFIKSRCDLLSFFEITRFETTVWTPGFRKASCDLLSFFEITRFETTDCSEDVNGPALWFAIILWNHEIWNNWLPPNRSIHGRLGGFCLNKKLLNFRSITLPLLHFFQNNSNCWGVLGISCCLGP